MIQSWENLATNGRTRVTNVERPKMFYFAKSFSVINAMTIY